MTEIGYPGANMIFLCVCTFILSARKKKKVKTKTSSQNMRRLFGSAYNSLQDRSYMAFWVLVFPM